MNNGKRKSRESKENGREVQFALAEIFLDNPQMLEALGYDSVSIDGTAINSKRDLAKILGRRKDNGER